MNFPFVYKLLPLGVQVRLLTTYRLLRVVDLRRYGLLLHFVTERKRSWGKVMFSQASVCSLGGW